MISKEKEQELTAVLEQFYKEVEIKAKETGHPEFAEQFKRSYGDTLEKLPLFRRSFEDYSELPHTGMDEQRLIFE